MNEIIQSEQGQFNIALWIVLNSIWLVSWIISIVKYFWPDRIKKRTSKKMSLFSRVFYCRRKANPWRDSIPEIMDYVMLIYNAVVTTLIATFLLAKFLFQS